MTPRKPMKPVRAWAIEEDGELLDHFMFRLPVYYSLRIATADTRRFGGRVVPVEIREIKRKKT